MEHDPIIRTLMDRMKEIHHLNIVLMRRNRKVAQLRDAHIRRDRAALLHASALESIRRTILGWGNRRSDMTERGTVDVAVLQWAQVTEDLSKAIDEINVEANRDVRGKVWPFRR